MGMEQPHTLRMYILLKEGIDLGHAMLAVAHGTLACYLEYEDDPEMELWLEHSFRKVVCLVNDKEFEKAKMFDRAVVMTESGLDGAETAVVLAPRIDESWPKAVKWYRLVNLENFQARQRKENAKD